jgi:hypothetical protein
LFLAGNLGITAERIPSVYVYGSFPPKRSHASDQQKLSPYCTVGRKERKILALFENHTAVFEFSFFKNK